MTPVDAPAGQRAGGRKKGKLAGILRQCDRAWSWLLLGKRCHNWNEKQTTEDILASKQGFQIVNCNADRVDHSLLSQA